MSAPQKNKPSLSTRSQSGSVSVLLPLAILLSVVGIGAFAMDISHNVTVRTELQNASDAAALAGARDMLESTTQNNAENSALQVAEDNFANGKPVSNSSDRTNVTAQCAQSNVKSQYNCIVSADTQIDNTFGKVFGHNSDDIATKSSALAARSIIGVGPNTAFPLAVSVDTTNGGQVPLYTRKLGDEIRLEINSQQFKNAAWTSLSLPNTNASWLNAAIDGLLGIGGPATNIPAAEIGDDLNLTNGVASQKDLAKAPRLGALKDRHNLVIPLMAGDPPYNQSRKLVGFITVDIKDVIVNQNGGEVETIVAVLRKGIINRATPGEIKSTDSTTVNNGLTGISPGTVKLVTEDVAYSGITNESPTVATSTGK